MKICSKCKQQKELSSFSTGNKSKDGIHSWCKPCVNAQRKSKQHIYIKTQRRYKSDNAEHIKSWLKERSRTECFKAKKSHWDRCYRKRNSEKIAEKKSDYYSTRQHLRRAEYQRNKQRYIAAAYKRLYQLKALTPEGADKALIQKMYDKAKELTSLTGVRHEVDHIIPISKGGLHHQDNLQVLVWIENRKKGNKIPIRGGEK